MISQIPQQLRRISSAWRRFVRLNCTRGRSPASDEPNVSQTKQQRTPILQRLGPGLITGAADDDPSGIATYSQAGAQYGFCLLYTSDAADE